MGEAKRRGSYAQRKEAAIAQAAPFHKRLMIRFIKWVSKWLKK